MAERIRKKEISPVELVEAHLERIERLNPRLNAYVQVDAEGARRAAHEAETAVIKEKTLGPLHGVPISIKSSIEVAGMRCESGTRLRAGFVPTQDAPVVARLRAAGAIVLGVTNTPELLMAWETDNLLYGPHTRRFQRWRGSRDCRGHVRRWRRQRRWRFDSRSGSLHWHLWFEADSGTNSCDRTLSRLPGTICLHRRRRPNGSHHCRPEAFVRSNARTRRRRYVRRSRPAALAQSRRSQEFEDWLFRGRWPHPGDGRNQGNRMCRRRSLAQRWISSRTIPAPRP